MLRLDGFVRVCVTSLGLLSSLFLHRPTQDSLVVSLTSYPGRIRTTLRTILCLQLQSLQPSRIILVLARGQFPAGLKDLPIGLRWLVGHSRRLEVDWIDKDYGSYKKIVPLSVLSSQQFLLTVDDDVLYPVHMLRTMWSAARHNPGVIVGTRGAEIRFVADGRLAPYVEWFRALPGRPSRLVFLTGRGGILYPPGVLDPSVLDFERAQSFCPRADDIWFKYSSLLRGSLAMVVGDASEFPSNGASQESALFHENVVAGSNNDDCLRRLVDETRFVDLLLSPIA